MTAHLIQGSPAWIAARVGKVTASRMADVVVRTKTGWGAARAKYLIDIVGERLTGEPAPVYVSAAMQWGTLHEGAARAAYEFLTDAVVEPVGFVPHPTIEFAGASPDGLVDLRSGDDGLVEIKCPLTATHLDTLLNGLPAEHLPQIMWQLACTGRRWCDFVSFDPRLPQAMQLVVIRVARDDRQITELEAAVTVFLAEVDEKIASLLAACAIELAEAA